ncbi:hypothetical protein [Aureliella helgolandensis]|uniref:SAF domain-containing protein n=1 Tax=Aureliella helgolandensis TaxID=2527968 RepID=A0A518G145_9BACT|nr:hypothetical protein [Aureliella helgolandensis]QDV22323.1 hypothetical protein Q31a_06070 [Aureliella helgolandensis]
MNDLIKVFLAVALGLAAAGINWLYLAGQSRPTSYIAIAQPLKRGAKIEADSLMAIPIPGDEEKLRKTLIPYAKRSILLGQRTSRIYASGDIFFASDLSPIVEKEQWEVIGPFELISVGERFKQSGDAMNQTASTQGNTVTIAVNADFDEQASRLLNVVAQERGSRGEADTAEIIAVQVVPPNSIASHPNLQGRSATANVVYQTVSLDGIANVPSVLLEGDFIRFVMPGL